MRTRNIFLIVLIISTITCHRRGKHKKGKGKKYKKGKRCKAKKVFEFMNFNKGSLDKNAMNAINHSSKSKVKESIEDVIKEDEKDIPKIHEFYNKACQQVLEFKRGKNNSKTKLDTLKRDICSSVVNNSGEELKNILLAQKMIGFLVQKISEVNWDPNLDKSLLLASSGKQNSKFINVIRDNKIKCWQKDDEQCGLTDQVKKTKGFSSYIETAESAKKTIKKFVFESSSSSSSQITSLGGMRRVLQKKKKKGNKGEVDDTILRTAIKEIMDQMDTMIMKIRFMNDKQREKFLKPLKPLKVDFAEVRCEKKYGANNCVKMNEVAFCYKCSEGYKPVWSTYKTCGCQQEEEEEEAQGDLWKSYRNGKKKRRILGEKKENEAQKEVDEASLIDVLRDHFLTKEVERLASEMLKGLDSLDVNEAFFFKVEDMFRAD